MNVIGQDIFQNELNIYINRCKVVGSIDMHSHNFVEIAYVASGSGLHCTDGKQIPCHSGQYFIINYNIPHQFRSEQPMVIYNCIFTPEFIDCSLTGCRDLNRVTKNFPFRSIFNTGKDLVSSGVFADTGYVEMLFTKMHKEFIKKQKGYSELLRSFIVELLIYTLRQTDTQEDSMNNQNGSIGNTVSYIRQHFNEKITLETLSAIAYLSPGHFCRQFKNSTGITATEFIKRLRVEQAKQLLIATEKSVEEISGLVGYQDAKHFSYVFASAEGRSPVQYRKWCRTSSQAEPS